MKNVVCVYVMCALLASVALASPIESGMLDGVEPQLHEPQQQHHGKAAASAGPKIEYFLKCIHDQCNLIESDPHASVVLEEQSEDGSVSKRSSGGSLNTMMKRFFGVNEEAVKTYKPEEIKCWSDDCKIQMAKISKRNRSGLGTLACVGDPYNYMGSRCVPIEGLYIGK